MNKKQQRIISIVIVAFLITAMVLSLAVYAF